MRFGLVVMTAGFVAWAAAAPAQTEPGSGADDARYKFYRVGDSFVRLDSQTGQVAQCGHGPAGWTCQAAPEDRAALEQEIARLQGDNAALKSELLARGLELPRGLKPAEQPPPPVAKAPEQSPELMPRMPTDADLDRLKALIGKVWKRLVELVAELQRDIQRKS